MMARRVREEGRAGVWENTLTTGARGAGSAEGFPSVEKTYLPQLYISSRTPGIANLWHRGKEGATPKGPTGAEPNEAFY
jgi:hypothetical protein